MRDKSNVKAGGVSMQHNQTTARGLKAKSSVKAGGNEAQHNQSVRESRGLRIKSGVKAGDDAGRMSCNHNQTLVSTR